MPWVGEALPIGKKHRRPGTPTTTGGWKVETRGLHNLRSGNAVFSLRLGGRVPQNAGPSALGLRILDRVGMGRPDCVPCGAPILRGRIVKNPANLEPGSPGLRAARRFFAAGP